MKCSVVIPTVNRSEAVRNLIADIALQSNSDVDIVVVDQSDTEDRELKQNFDIQYVHHAHPNTPHARNLGVARAKGDVVIFFDDDSRIHDPRLIAKTLDFFSRNPQYAGVAFQVEDRNALLNRENQKINSRIMQVGKTGKIFPFARGAHAQDVTAPRGGGMAFWRRAIMSVGGFDERYTGNAMREETDFSLRIVKQVGKIRYLPSLSVEHLGLARGGSRRQSRMDWYFDFFSNEILFQLTHASHFYLPLFFFRKMRPIVACMLYYGKGRPRAIATPLKGFWNGYRKYRKNFTRFTFA